MALSVDSAEREQLRRERKQAMRARHRQARRQRAKAAHTQLREADPTAPSRAEQRAQIDAELRTKAQSGLVIAVDLAFEQRLPARETGSLAMQLCHCYALLRRSPTAISLHLVSCAGAVREELAKMGAEHWVLGGRSAEPLEAVFAGQLHRLVYLSPDAPEPLTALCPQSIYVIGGIVDSAVESNLSLDRAARLGVQARRLPLEGVTGLRRRALNLNAVFAVLEAALRLGDVAGAAREVLGGA